MATLDLFAMARENVDALAAVCAKHTGVVVEFAEAVAGEVGAHGSRHHVEVVPGAVG